MCAGDAMYGLMRPCARYVRRREGEEARRLQSGGTEAEGEGAEAVQAEAEAEGEPEAEWDND